MTKLNSAIFVSIALSLAAPVFAAPDVQENDRLFDANGAQVGKVNRVAVNGDVLVIYKGKIRQVDASTLSDKDGKLVTSLTKKEIRRLK